MTAEAEWEPDNLPQPLLNPLMPLLGDTNQQMSFGERSVLEGVLTQCQPKVSVEIGTHQGGSLRRIAAHSGEVHAFDLDDRVADKTMLTNVEFHYGDSRALIPAFLKKCVASRTPIDFALVDGDHSAEGVRADLANLLASPGCARTVILAHDTMNAEVRSGLGAVGLANHPRVVYFDLDFVPGYRFATGSYAGQYFGGLGLVITGDRRKDGYRGHPAQTRYLPAFDLMHQG
jgi:hypothetical protein